MKKNHAHEIETYLSLKFLLNKFSSYFFLSFPTPIPAAELVPLLLFPSFYKAQREMVQTIIKEMARGGETLYLILIV
jgi:hypothetical protein